MISPTSSRTSCSTTWEPMKPAPPITRTRRPRRSISLPPVEPGDAVHDVGLLPRLFPNGRAPQLIYTRGGNFRNTQKAAISNVEMILVVGVFVGSSQGRGKFGFEIFRTSLLNDPAAGILRVKKDEATHRPQT